MSLCRNVSGALVFVLPCAVSAQSVGEAIELRVGEARSTTQRADESIRYRLDIDAGKTYLLEVPQEGLDVEITIDAPDGTSRSFNAPLHRDEREIVLIEAGAGGAYGITVAPREHTGAAGAHRIEARDASTIDGAVLAAWRLMSEAAEAYFEIGEKAAAAAISAYEEAAERWGRLGAPRERAYALYAIARIENDRTRNSARATAMAELAAGLYAQLEEPVLFASATYLQAAALIDIAAAAPDPHAVFDRALALFAEAAAIQARLGLSYDHARTINFIGLTRYRMGEWTAARVDWQRAAAMFQGADEWSGELLALQNIAVVDAEEGHFTRAIEALERVLELQPPDRNHGNRVDVLMNLGGIHRQVGNLDEALHSFSSSLAIAEGIEDVYGVGWSLAGIGETYFSMGELALAADYLREALPKEREAGDSRGEAAVLRHLGEIEALAGNYAAALDYHEQALVHAASPPDRALVQLHVARDLAALGRADEALETAREAVQIAAGTNSHVLSADAWQALGDVHLTLGEADAAQDPLRRALEIYEFVGSPVEQARTLHSLALAARARGETEDAIDYGQASLEQIERLRGQLAKPELRAFYLSARRTYYELQIDMLMERHRVAGGSTDEFLLAALAMSERARARVLVDLLQEEGIDAGHADPEVGARRNALYRQLSEHRYRHDRLLEQSDVDEEQLAHMNGELVAIENELHVLETESLRQNPEFRGSRMASTISALDVQDTLDAETTLIQYALGAERSYVWIVTRTDIRGLELPDRATIEALARRVFEGLRVHAPGSDSARRVAREAAALADAVLAPIEPLLEGRRLLVSADGALVYVPFSVLPLSTEGGNASRLLERYEIVNVASMSAVVSQRLRQRPQAPSKRIAVFADPVFDVRDLRLAAAANVSAVVLDGAQDASVRGGRAGGAELGRLPLTAREAGVIADLVAADQRFVALGFEASRDAVVAADLSDYAILHFATHGLIDSRYPDLSALVLSQYDEAGNARNGRLELHEIYGLRLNADLVVLSACETALGREIHGEGLLGFTQGFLYAGAKSLVATLWPVSDRATAELMSIFYDYVLNRGVEPAEALRQAQLEISAERRWSDPYFWAAFTFVGDWQ